MQPRFARRKDNTDPAIAEALENHGYTVERDGKVDLLVRHPTWQKNIWVKGECKTPNRAGGRHKLRTDLKGQQTQADYCIAHCVPYWFNAEQALAYLESFGAQFKIGAI